MACCISSTASAFSKAARRLQIWPCEKETQYDDSAPKGEESVVQQGQDRIVRNTYRITYHDGKQVSKDLTGSETTQEMINEITSIGTSTAGTTDSGISYSDKFQVKAFAYTAPEGACGAYGGLAGVTEKATES